MNRITHTLILLLMLTCSFVGHATVTYNLSASGSVHTDSETLLSSSGSATGDTSVQFENVSGTHWTSPYAAFYQTVSQPITSTDIPQNWNSINHATHAESDDYCANDGLFDTWKYDPKQCGMYELDDGTYDFSYASAYSGFSTYTIANDFSTSKAAAASSAYMPGGIIAITAVQMALEHHGNAGYYYYDAWRPGAKNPYNGNFGASLFTETAVPVSSSHFTGCSTSTSDVASCSSDDANLYLTFNDGSKLTLTLSSAALNRGPSYGGESIVGGIMQFTNMYYQWGSTDLTAQYQGGTRDESITVQYGFSSNGMQFDNQQLSVSLNVVAIAACSVSVPSDIDFGTVVGSPVGLTKSFDVTATCDTGISDRHSDSGEWASNSGLFRINIYSPTNDSVSCDTKYKLCIPFKTADGTNDTRLCPLIA